MSFRTDSRIFRAGVTKNWYNRYVSLKPIHLNDFFFLEQLKNIIEFGYGLFRGFKKHNKFFFNIKKRKKKSVFKKTYPVIWGRCQLIRNTNNIVVYLSYYFDFLKNIKTNQFISEHNFIFKLIQKYKFFFFLKYKIKIKIFSINFFFIIFLLKLKSDFFKNMLKEKIHRKNIIFFFKKYLSKNFFSIFSLKKLRRYRKKVFNIFFSVKKKIKYFFKKHQYFNRVYCSIFSLFLFRYFDSILAANIIAYELGNLRQRHRYFLLTVSNILLNLYKVFGFYDPYTRLLRLDRKKRFKNKIKIHGIKIIVKGRITPGPRQRRRKSKKVIFYGIIRESASYKFIDTGTAIAENRFGIINVKVICQQCIKKPFKHKNKLYKKNQKNFKKLYKKNKFKNWFKRFNNNKIKFNFFKFFFFFKIFNNNYKYYNINTFFNKDFFIIYSFLYFKQIIMYLNYFFFFRFFFFYLYLFLFKFNLISKYGIINKILNYNNTFFFFFYKKKKFFKYLFIKFKKILLKKKFLYKKKKFKLLNKSKLNKIKSRIYY